jgi:hypothetical protein
MEMDERPGEIEQKSTQSAPEPAANPEKVKAIIEWLESKEAWGSGKTLAEVAGGSPDNITKEDVRAAFLSMKPLRGVARQNHDIRGYYLTALADKVLENDQDTIELVRPETGEYDKFRNIGSGWERGTLVLRGNFVRENVGDWMKGGRVEVHSGVGSRAGSLMSGGVLEIKGDAGYGAGFGMTGGKIHIQGNAGANVGDRMHDGSIVVDGQVGPNWNEYGVTEGPNIGINKTGGKITVGGTEY